MPKRQLLQIIFAGISSGKRSEFVFRFFFLLLFSFSMAGWRRVRPLWLRLAHLALIADTRHRRSAVASQLAMIQQYGAVW